MKKLLFVVVGLLASSTFAASSGTLLLQGTVVAVNDIVINEIVGENTNLNIIAGETDKAVASAVETSNSLSGYKITMRSANASKLQNSLDATKNTSYTLKYDTAGPFTMTTSDQVVKNVSSLSGLTTDTSAISVSVAPYATAPAGTYSDTVTVTISAN